MEPGPPFSSKQPPIGGTNSTVENTQSPSLFTQVSGSTTGNSSAYVVSGRRITGSAELPSSNAAISSTSTGGGGATSSAGKASTTPNTPSHNALPVSNNHPLLDSHNTAMMPVLPPAMTSSNAGSERATSVQVPPYHAPHPPHGVYHAYFSNTNNLLSSRSGAATATANGIKNSSDVSNPSSVNTSGDSRTALPSVLPVGSMAHNGDAPIHHHKEAPNTSAHTIPENDTTVAHVPGVGTGAGDASSHQAPSGSSSGIRWWRTPTSSGRTPVKIGSELPLSGAATARPETGGGHAISSTTSPQSSQPSSARLMTTNHTMEAAGSRYPSNTAHRYHLTDYATESELPATTAGFTNTRFLPSQSAVVSGGRGEKAHYARSTSHTPDRRRLPMSSHQPHATSEPPPSHLSSDGRVISPRPFTSPHTPVTQHSDDGNHGFGGAGKKSPVLRSAQTVCPKTPPRVIEPLLPSHVTPVKPAANGDSSSTAPQPAPHHHHGETDSPPPRQVIVGIDVMRVVAQKRHSPALPRDDEGQDSLPQPLEGVAGTTESRPNSRVNTRVRNVRHGSASDRRSEYTLARRQSPSVQAEVTRLHSTAAGASSGNSSNGSTAQLVPLRASSTLTAAQPALPPTVTPAMVTKTGKPRPEPLLAALDKELSGQNQHQPTALSDVTVLPPAVSHSVAPSMLPPHATASAAATAAPDLLLFHPIHTIGSSVPAPVSHQGSGVHTPQTNAQIITTSPSTGGGGLVEGVRQMSTSFNSQRGNSRRTSRRGSEVTLMAAIAAAEAVAQSTPHTHPHSSSRFSSSGPGTTNENTLSVRDQTSPAMTMITTAENGLLPPVGGAPAHLHSVGGVPSLSGDQLSDAAANKSHAKPGPGHHGGGSPDLAFSPPSSAAQGIQLPSLMSGKTMPATAADVNTAMTVVGAGPAGKTVEDVSISTAEEHLAQHGEDTASKETKTTTTTTATITPQQQQQQQQRGIRWDPANEPKGKASSSAGAANSYTAATNNSSIALGTSSSALNFAALIQELDQRRQRIREQLNEMTKNVAGHSIFAIVRSTSTTQLHQILEAGLCNVNEQDHNGCTPLHIAASEGNQAIVRLLLSYGADILKKDFFGRTPLDCAAANRQSVGRYLISVLRERREAERKQAEKAKANSERAKQSVPSAGETAAAALVVGTPVAASHAPSHFSGGVDLLVTTTPSPERPSSPHNIGVKVGSTTSSTGPVSPDVRQLPPTQNFHSLLLNVMSDSEHVPSPPPAVANDLEPSNVGSKSDGISGAIGSGVFPAADVSKLSHSPNQQFSSSPPGHGTIQATPKSSPLFSPYHRAESQLASTVNPSTSFNPMAPGLHFTPRHSILPGVTEERYRAAAAAAAAAESTQRKTVDTPGLLRLPIPAGPDPPSTDIFPSQRGYSIYEEGAVTTLLEHVVAQEQHRRKPVREEKKEFSTFTAINDYVPLIVCMSGLPGRGKSFISKRVLRYLNWKGVPCEVFNAGNYRRQLLGVEGTADAAFFDPNNPVGKQLRERMAELACEDLVKFIADHQPLSVGILDATNTTRSRRRWLETFFAEAAKKHSNPDGTPLAYRLLFIESVCTDENIITENILRSKCDNDDFKGTEDTNAVISEFRERIHQYEKVYEPLHADENFSFIKIINVKHHVVLHRVAGGLGSRIAFFLMNLHPVAFPVYLALPGETVGESKGEFGGDERLTERGVQYAFALRQFMEERFVPNMLVIHATSKSVVNTLLPATVPSAASGIVGGSVAASTTNTNVPDLPGFEDLQQIQGAESRQRRGFSSPVEEGSINRLSGTSHHHHHHSSTANLGTSTTGGNVSRGLPRVTSGDRILLERQLTNRAAMPVVVHRHVHANAREMPKPDSQSFIGTPTSGVPTSGAAASFAANSSGSPSSQRDLFSPGVAWRQNKETTPTDKKSGAMEAKKNTPISSAGPQLLPTPTKVSVAEVPASTLVVKSGERPDHGGSASTSTSIGLNVRITEDIVVESPKQKRGRHHHRRRRRGGVPEKQKDESGGADNNGKHRGPVHHRHGHRHHHTIMSTILTEHDPQPSISTPSVRDPSKNTSLTTTSGKENPRQESPASPEQDKDSMGSSISSSSSSGSSASSSSSASAKLVDQQAAPGRRRSAEIELGLYAALSPTYTESDSAGSSTNSYASSSTGTSNASNSGSGNPTLKIDHSAPAVSSMIVKSSVVTVREPTPEGVDHDDGNPHGSSSRPPLSHPPLHPLIHSPIATAASRSSHSHHKQPSAEDQKKKKIKRGTAGGGNSSGSSPALSRQHSFTNNPSVIRTTANGGLGGIGKGGLGAAGANRPLPRLASSSHLAATHHHVPYPHPTSSREPPPTQQPYEGNEDNMENGEELDEVLCPVPGLDDLNYGKLNGRRPGWFQEQNPRAAQILFSKLGRTNSVASLLAGDGMERSHTTDEEDEEDEQDEQDVEEEEAEVLKEVLAAAQQQQQEEGADHNESSAREPVSAPPLLPFLIKGNTTRTVLSTLRHCWRRFEKHYKNAPHASSTATTYYPTLNYTALFPNGESVRQVISRLEPALMAVMRSQKPVFVVAPAIPTQGLLAFFLDVMPEKSPLLKLPKNGILEITVKGDVMVHPLPPAQMGSSLAGDESLMEITV